MSSIEKGGSWGDTWNSGVPNMVDQWMSCGYGKPVLSEDYDPEVSTVLLPLSADSADGIPGKLAVNVGRKATGQTIENENAIVEYLAEHGESKSAEIAASIGLGTSRTNDLLRDLVDGGVVKARGGSRNRTYRIAE